MNEKIPIRKLLLWTMAWGVLCCNSAQGASFDCTKAGTKVEKMICADPVLSQLDEDLSTAYQDAKKRTNDPGGLRAFPKKLRPRTLNKLTKLGQRILL